MLTNLLETWSAFYSNHAALRTAIEFLHIGGLVVAGGSAIAADRILLRGLGRDTSVRRAELGALRGTHRVVVIGLVVITLSGILLFASDVDSYLYSAVFWIKMGLIVALLVNGLVLVGAERRVERGDERAWQPLTYTAWTSLTLWLLITLASSALTNL